MIRFRLECCALRCLVFLKREGRRKAAIEATLCMIHRLADLLAHRDWLSFIDLPEGGRAVNLGCGT